MHSYALRLGVVLKQPVARGKNCAIAYVSWTLNPAEPNCSVTHQEALAVVWALRHFHDIILGYPMTAYTHALQLLLSFSRVIKNLISWLVHWYLTIQELNPPFKYLPGHANAATDSLSRNVTVRAVAEKLSYWELHSAWVSCRPAWTWC